MYVFKFDGRRAFNYTTTHEYQKHKALNLKGFSNTIFEVIGAMNLLRSSEYKKIYLRNGYYKIDNAR